MKELTFILNGKEIILTADPFKRLLDVLREDLKLTGVKEGCGEGECGACAVLLDGILVNSCLVPVGLVAGREVMTPEGLAETEKGKQIVEALANAGAVQCGSVCRNKEKMSMVTISGSDTDNKFLRYAFFRSIFFLAMTIRTIRIRTKLTGLL